MKRIVPISIVLLIFAIALPLIVFRSSSEPEEAEVTEDPTEAAVTPQANFDFSAVAGEMDKSLTVTVWLDEAVCEMSMYEYLVGVVSAEMPVSFEPEALKAQAVAARTYTLYKMLGAANSNHPDAYVCGDYTCCKAYSSQAALQEHWGEDYSSNMAIIAAAVSETDGMCIVYENAPILAAFHSSSAGHTEASGNIWGDLPYLQSVQTFETDENVPTFYSAVTLTYDEFKETILAAYDTAVLEGEYSTWITDIVRSDSNRITSINVGGVVITGAEFRSLFSLRSTNIEIEFIDEGLTLSIEGYGHGVGMSQYGANVLAQVGLGYEQILTWYYTGVSLATMDTVLG